VRSNTVFFVDFLDQWNAKESPWHDQRVSPGRQPRHRSQGHQRGRALGFAGLTGNVVPRSMEVALPIEPHPTIRSAPG
jgi:hypothetical protein